MRGKRNHVAIACDEDDGEGNPKRTWDIFRNGVAIESGWTIRAMARGRAKHLDALEQGLTLPPPCYVKRSASKRAEQPSSNPEPVNLWELLTAALTGTPKGDAFLPVASKGAALAGQEFSLEVSAAGWVIRIHTCYGTQETLITIPADGSPPSLETREGEYYPAQDDADCPGCATCIPLRAAYDAESLEQAEETR